MVILLVGTSRRMDPSNKLEEDAVKAFEEIGIDGKKTKASGQVRGDGDALGGKVFTAECKYKSTAGFSISRSDFKKAEQQASTHGRQPVFFTRNKHGETVVTMKLEHWIPHMRQAFK